MKLHIAAGLALAILFLASCDDNTGALGDSTTNADDQFEVLSQTFPVSSRSIEAGSVLSRSQYSYLGHIKDPETGAYVSSHFTTQFAVLESFDGSELFPSQDTIASRDADGAIVADSCKLLVYFYNSVGDSLNAMKMTAYELAKPVAEGRKYYTDFDPEAEGLLRTGPDAIVKTKPYTAIDLNLSDSLRSKIVDKTNMQVVQIALNDPYTAPDGTRYSNYGTYILRSYFAHPDWYRNSYNFVHNVCPGFYIRCTDGLGVMSQVYMAELATYYRFMNDTIVSHASTLLSGTEEVMQTTKIENDKQSLSRLANDNSCTYLKTPAGIFTEVELPVDDIMNGHERDTLSSAKIVFTKLNGSEGDYAFGAPANVLMMPKDSLHTFFEDKDMPNSKTTFMAAYNSSVGTYTFNNISTLITAMHNSGKTTADWNKVVLVPVEISKNSQSTTSSITAVNNEMQLKSTRLIGGSANKREPLHIDVIYNRFTDK